MISKKDLSDDLVILIKDHDIDLRDINRAIRNYDPMVTKYTRDQQYGYSVRVEDRNRGVPAFWVDFYRDEDSGEIESEWNGFVYRTKWTEEIIESLFRMDTTVWEKAESVAFHYLSDQYLIDYVNGRYEFAFEVEPYTLMNKAKKNTVQPKPSAKTKETTKPRRRDRK